MALKLQEPKIGIVYGIAERIVEDLVECLLDEIPQESKESPKVEIVDLRKDANVKETFLQHADATFIVIAMDGNFTFGVSELHNFLTTTQFREIVIACCQTEGTKIYDDCCEEFYDWENRNPCSLFFSFNDEEEEGDEGEEDEISEEDDVFN